MEQKEKFFPMLYAKEEELLMDFEFLVCVWSEHKG